MQLSCRHLRVQVSPNNGATRACRTPIGPVSARSGTSVASAPGRVLVQQCQPFASKQQRKCVVYAQAGEENAPAAYDDPETIKEAIAVGNMLCAQSK